MSIFTRITATLGATAENAVSKLENHDAIAESALRQTRQAVVQARVRYARVKRDGDELRTRIESLTTQEAQWTERARAVAQEDESKAIACLDRRRQCRDKLEQTKDALNRHMALEQEVAARLKDTEDRLENITQQRNQMRSRESVARAMDAMSRIDSQGHACIDEIFDRWEVSIGETEIRSHVGLGQSTAEDPLRREFESNERTDELRLELDELLTDSLSDVEGDKDE